MERKLAAIFSADVKGYSRLMGEDDVGTIRTLTAYREVMTTLIQHHRGRVVDSPGDNHGKRASSAVKTEELHQVEKRPAGALAFDFHGTFAGIAA
jgi:class 3 adenylate cyclase